ncbi:hypothetical protein QYM36_001167 [Artemia franciscana]|nr:hypothetical protein QYM36_001167 [Artemia franciscana]
MICIKSALLFARSPLKVHIFAENELKKPLEDQLHSWRDSFDQHWTFVVQALSFPAESENEWKKLFKPCAAQRLFLPSAMNDTDAVIYVDIDTLFLSPVDILWDKFNFMNSSQMAALAPESEDFSTGWYNRFARHPYYGPLGLNSGVMLMNLTRFRRFQWELYLVPTYQQYKLNITWGDQDIINIIFHYHADKILVLPCEFNYRPDHCMYMSVCRTVENNGVYVLHGNRGAFINEKQPTFRAFYDSFNEFIPGEKLTSLVELVSAKFDATSPSNCGKMRKFLLKNLEY